MQHFSLKKGLNLPVLGKPRSGIEDGPEVRTVAVLGADYIGLKPRLQVEEGD
ncbi:MAG: NADH:ubiquinone reductase (Na(+)-transporting) subunit A, partial [Pseudomonadota bacterium]